MIVESVALPANYTKQMAEEYIRLSQDIATVGAASGTITPSHQYVVDAFAGDTNNRSRPPSLEFKFTYSDAPSPSLEDSRPPRIREGSLFGESWKEARKRLKAQSQYASLPHWEAKAFIVKHGDFVLQEQFVMQLIIQFQKIWEQVRRFIVLSVGSQRLTSHIRRNFHYDYYRTKLWPSLIRAVL